MFFFNSCWCLIIVVKIMVVNDEFDIYREKKLNIFVFDRWMFERYVSDNYV